MRVTEHSSEEIRNRILDGAMVRFGRHGFGKTTMNEIARDCSMSAGNLYRYFENKMEIGAGCARRCMGKVEAQLREVVRRPGLSPEARLEEFVLTKLRYTHGQFAEQPLLMDLVSYISNERWDIVQHHLETLRSLLAEILAEGNHRGRFEVEDVVETASMVLAAITKFSSPTFMGGFALKELEHEARGVVALIIHGLERR